MNHTRKVVISSAKNFLAHTPGLVRYGSKPIREIDNNPNTLQTIKEHSRGFTDAVSYPPNQVYIGGISVDNLAKTKQPWYSLKDNYSPKQPYGLIISEEEFITRMSMLDKFNLITLEKNFSNTVKDKLLKNGNFTESKVKNIDDGVSLEDINEELSRLAGHMELLDDYILNEKYTGKKINFLLQEINREVNTIGSKVDKLSIKHIVVDIKNNVEKIREQAQNIL